MSYPKRKPLPKRSDRYLISETVTLPGGQLARVQVNQNTGHARWNATQIVGVWKTIPGAVIDGAFYPLSQSDSRLIESKFRRRRRPSLYDGTYNPWT